MLYHGTTESWLRAVCFIVRFTFSDRNVGIFDNRAPRGIKKDSLILTKSFLLKRSWWIELSRQCM